MFWYDAALKSPMPFGNSPAAILGLVRLPGALTCSLAQALLRQARLQNITRG